MYFGGALVLIALGAILSFAVRDNIDAVDLTVIGYILMGVGALGIVLTLVTAGARRDRVVREEVVRRDDVPPPAP